MGTVYFSHHKVGNLAIDNGMDSAEWGYGLNTATFPTYAGEVVQILSVYVDDVTLRGTVATYEQMESIYYYFSQYLLNATQTGSFDPYPVYLSYPERDWFFKIYPKEVPGFRYGRDVVAPTWQINAHVIDDTPDLDLIKDGIKGAETKKLLGDDTFAFVGEISPKQGNPDTDPFQTYTAPLTQEEGVIQKYADYFSSLIPSYTSGDFSALTAGIGSKPAMPDPGTGGTQVQTGAAGNGGATAPSGGSGTSSGPPHNSDYQTQFRIVFSSLHDDYMSSGCNGVATTADPTLYNPDQASNSQKQASADAINAFTHAPYSCKTFKPWSFDPSTGNYSQ